MVSESPIMRPSTTPILPPTTAIQAPGTNQSGAVGLPEPSYAVLKFMESFCLLSAACGMVGNGLVLWFLGFRIRRNHFTVYILNLAAADFGYLLCIAVETVQYLMQFNVGVQFGIFLFLDLFMYGTGLYLLTAISIERCLSVLSPIWCRTHRPKHLSAVVAGLLWALSLLLNTLGYVLCTVRPSPRVCRRLLIAIGALDFLVCTPLMLLFSLTLFLRVKCSSQPFQTGRLFIVIMLTILLFLIFAVPLSVLILLDFLGQKFLYSPEIGFVLSCVNSTLNPVTTVSPSPASPTEGDDICETDVTNVAIHSVTLLISLCGLPGNGAVLWLLNLESHNFGIFDMAFSDFLFLLFTVPSTLPYLVEDVSCSLIVPLTYVSFLFQLSMVSFYWGLYRLARSSHVVNMYKLFQLYCCCNLPKRLWLVVETVQYWAFFALLTVIPVLTSLCPSHEQNHCRAALISMYTITLLLFAAPMAISSTINVIKAMFGSKKQQPKMRENVIALIVLLTLLLSLCNFLQQLGYSLVSSQVFFLLTCIHSTIKPFIYFLAGKCWSPCSMGSLRLSLQRVFEEKKDKTACSWDHIPLPAQCPSMEVSTVSPSPASPTEGDDLCEIDVTNVAIHSVALLICLCGLAGNGAVLWLLSPKKLNFGIFDLAVADFLFLLFTVPAALLFVVEDMSCSVIVPLMYMSFLFQLSVFSYYWGLFLLTAFSLGKDMTLLCRLCCWQLHHRLRLLVWGTQYWAFFSLFTVIPALIYQCPSHEQQHCQAALMSVYAVTLLLFAAPVVTSSAIDLIKARFGSKKQQPRRRDHVIFIIVLLTLVLGLCNFLQQLGFFLLTCIHSSIKPFIYFLAGRCWSPCSMESLRLSLQRVFDEKEEKGTRRNDATTDTG
ncbi:Proto-oncogene Mas, partial [Lamprotornis superbus]